MVYRERVLAALVVALWGAYAAGRILLAAHAFRIWVVLPLALVAAAIAWRRRPARLPIPPMSRGFVVLLALVLGILGVRVLKGAASPPLAWDALTYHLFKAGRFVETGRATFESAPDGWGYYESFPAGGSVLHAFGMLVARDGALVPWLGGAFALFAAYATYVLARRLGAERAAGGLAGLAVASTPALASIVTTGYVDVLVAGGIVAAVALAPVPGDAAPWRRAALAGAACGLAAAAKTSAVPAAVALTAAIAVRAFLPGLLLGGVAFATALPEYLGGWLRTGNPLYPFGLTVGGHTVLEGNASLSTLIAARLPMHDVSGYPAWEIFAWLGGTWRWPHSDFAGLGAGAGLVVALAVAGLVAAVREREARKRILAPIVVGGILALAAWSPDSLALRTLWASVFGRHVLPIWAILVSMAATFPWRLGRFAWIPAAAAGIAMSIPFGWGRADVLGTAILAAAAALGAGGWLASGRRFAALAFIPLVVAVPFVRGKTRHEVWREAADTTHGPYDFHALDPDAIAAWPMWERLDAAEPSRIAVTCGWNGVSQSWFLYPLLGARLRHEVVYVPPTIDGSIVDYANAEALNAKAQLRGYLRNLLARGVDRVVVLHPPPPENAAWLVRLPDVFVPEWSDPAHGNAMYRFDAERARALVEAP